MKQPRLDVRDALSRPAARNLFGLLLKKEDPVRLKMAREELKLSIGQFGLAMRSLERHGLVQRRNIALEGETQAGRLQHQYLEATDLGREHAQSLGEIFAQDAMKNLGAPGPL